MLCMCVSSRRLRANCACACACGVCVCGVAYACGYLVWCVWVFSMCMAICACCCVGLYVCMCACGACSCGFNLCFFWPAVCECVIVGWWGSSACDAHTVFGKIADTGLGGGTRHLNVSRHGGYRIWYCLHCSQWAGFSFLLFSVLCVVVCVLAWVWLHGMRVCVCMRVRCCV
eukprot:GDKI01011098.1.p1 GENE.GDKI01011098.1~~GDKI01011098.1.p1  ORF type:complete len:172 (-),score=27.59 GDKI01011098.1:379-894(-)